MSLPAMPRQGNRPPFALGISVAAVIVAVEIVLALFAGHIVPTRLMDLVFLLGVLVPAFVWGLELGVATAVVSSVVYGYFLIPPTGRLHLAKGGFLGILVTLVGAALLARFVSALVRPPAAGTRETGEAIGTARSAGESVRDVLRIGKEQLWRILDEQAALRRLATLVAHGGPQAEVLDAIAREAGRILGAEHSLVVRYERDGMAMAVARWHVDDLATTMPGGARWKIEPGTVTELVARTGAPARIGPNEGSGEPVVWRGHSGITSSVGCPITVGRSLWGLVIVSTRASKPLPADTGNRMRDFTDLAAAAIANARSHADLKASRARVVAAADQARRRIERDLHDGAQQRLIAVGLQIREIEDAVPSGLAQLRDKLSNTARVVDETRADLQEISRGLHPAVLAKGGLKPALSALARRSAVEVDLRLSLDRRLPERAETTVFHVVSEALANAARHAHASIVRVDLAATGRIARLFIRDDGIGGADLTRGSGLIGLADRVEAIGGTLRISSPVGVGTTLVAEIPAEPLGDESR